MYEDPFLTLFLAGRGWEEDDEITRSKLLKEQYESEEEEERNGK